MFFKRTSQPVQDAVARGMELLDRVRPGWHRNINTDSLNIARSDQCALGQTYGSYGAGVGVLRMDKKEAAKHGFYQSWRPGVMVDYEALTAEWRRQIEVRLDAEREQWRQDMLLAKLPGKGLRLRRHANSGSRW